MDESTPDAEDSGTEAQTDTQRPPRVPKGADSVTPEEAAATVEAILFASDTPLKASRICLVGQLTPRAVREAVQALNDRYDQADCTFRIEEIAGGYQMLTRPEYHDILSRLHESRRDHRLSQAAMETLAIVAYRQPILRADVEAIRGVATGEVIRGLLDRQLLKIVGRADVIGRPMLYGTTPKFLELFGLKGLDDLPKVEELRSGATAAPPPGKPPTAVEAEPQPQPAAEPEPAEDALPAAEADVEAEALPPADQPQPLEEPAGQ